MVAYLFPINVHNSNYNITIFHDSHLRTSGQTRDCQEAYLKHSTNGNCSSWHARQRLLRLLINSFYEPGKFASISFIPFQFPTTIPNLKHVQPIQPDKALNIRNLPMFAPIDIIISVNQPGKLGTSCSIAGAC